MFRSLVVCFAVWLSVGATPPVSAHELNPAVIEAIAGEIITYDSHHDEVLDDVVADPRSESRTFYSFPEWYIVYSAQEYADFVAAGNRPSQFPYFAAIGQMWDSWALTEVAAGVPPDATTDTILWTIAISFTVEYGLVGMYENTIGWLNEWLHFGYKTAEDTYIDEQAKLYGAFLNQTPWYDFAYGKSLGGLWQTYGWSSLSPRGIERRIAYTVGYGAKAAYAAGIRALSAASFEGGAGQITVVTVVADPATLNSLGGEYEAAVNSGEYVVSLPRYRAFKNPIIALARMDVELITIQGHSTIALSVVTPREVTCDLVISNQVFGMPLVTDGLQTRRVLSVSVSELSDVLDNIVSCGFEVEHVYDY